MRTIIFWTAVLLGAGSAQALNGNNRPAYGFDDFEDTYSGAGYGGLGGNSRFDDWSQPTINHQPFNNWLPISQNDDPSDHWRQFSESRNPYEFNEHHSQNEYNGYGSPYEFNGFPNAYVGSSEFTGTPNFRYEQEFPETPYLSRESYLEPNRFLDFPQSFENSNNFASFGSDPENGGFYDPFQGDQQSVQDFNNFGSAEQSNNFVFSMEMPDITEFEKIVSALAKLPKDLKQKMRNFYVSELEPHFENYPSAKYLCAYIVNHLDKMLEAEASGKPFDQSSFDNENTDLQQTVNPMEVLSAAAALPTETKVALKELYESLLPHFQNYPYADQLFSAKVQCLTQMIEADNWVKTYYPDQMFTPNIDDILKTQTSTYGFENHGLFAENPASLEVPFQAPSAGVDLPKLFANPPATPSPIEAELPAPTPAPAVGPLVKTAATVPVEEPAPLTKNQTRNKKRAEQRRRKAEREKNAALQSNSA